MEKSKWITNEDCIQLLKTVLHKNETKFKILDFIVNRIEKRSEIKYARLTIMITMFEEVKKLNFFCKIYNDTEVLNATKELFVKQIMDQVQKYVGEYEVNSLPQCFHYKNNILIFEDLKLKGFRKLASKQGQRFDLHHLKVALRALAKFHSMSLIYEHSMSKKLKRFYKITDEYDVILEESLFNKSKLIGHIFYKTGLLNLRALIDQQEALESGEAATLKSKVTEEAEKLADYVKPSKQFTNVICHGDVWQGNLMFKYEDDLPVACKFINFYNARYNPPAHDVLNLIYYTTNIETRKEHLDELLYHYYQCLETDLGDATLNIRDYFATYDEFLRSCKCILNQVKLNVALNLSKLLSYPLHENNSTILERYCEDIRFACLANEIIQELREQIQYPRFSRDDCNRVLKRFLKSNKFKLTKFHVEILGGFTGLAGDYARITAETVLDDKKSEQSFFAKMWPDNEVKSKYIEDRGAFRKEILIYDELFKSINEFVPTLLNQCVPSCYLTRDKDVIVMNDLSAEGYKIPNKRETLDLDHMIVLVKFLAKLHASCLIYEEKMTKISGQNYSIKRVNEECLYETYFKSLKGKLAMQDWYASIKGLLAEIDYFKLDGTLSNRKNFKQTVQDMSEHVIDLVQPSKKHRNLFTHGDLWANNIMIKYDEQGKPQGAKFVDFQLARYVPPAQDLMALIYLNTAREFREKHMYRLVGLYYATLEALTKLNSVDIKPILPFDTFLGSCEDVKPFVLLQTATYFQLVLLKDEDLETFFRNYEICSKALNQDRSLLVMAYVETDTVYRNRLRESVLDLRDLCERMY